ncbi:MAG TPA: rhamnogalacturonan acetylesterase [Phnomibacter sp.]|nr:rhamnogalacturonan acetylesterase [Phnomibacter sp.]
MSGKLLLLVSLLGASFLLPGKKHINIFLAGDSTIAIKDIKAYPENGWGMPFVYFWDSTVTVVNNARNGRSSKSFIYEGLWKSTIDAVKEGDYVMIQFGHNDESVDKKERYSTPDTFKMNLTKFITETRAKNATPILLTPVSRRKFDAEGKAVETHAAYSALVREVAKEQNAFFIDLDEKSRALYQQFGEANSKWLFLQLQPNEHPNHPDGKNDNTHFSEFGARLVAQLVLSELKKMNIELTERVVAPVKK